MVGPILSPTDTPTVPMNEQTLLASGWQSMIGEGFTAQLGAIWVRGPVKGRTVGFIATAQQGNNTQGAVHGGALMTFADIALGFGAADALGGKNLVTAQLQLQFVSGGKVGEFISCEPEVIRASRHLIFVRGLLCADDRVVASAEGLWKVLER